MQALAVTDEHQVAQPADALEQCVGKNAPNGSIVYLCSGLNEHRKKCGKFLLVWLPPAQVMQHRNELKIDHGRVEVKCRRCKTLNFIPLDPEL
jgi:hypothetical protein